MRLIVGIFLVILLDGNVSRYVGVLGCPVRSSAHFALSLMLEMRWILVVSTMVRARRLRWRLVLLRVLSPLFVVGCLRCGLLHPVARIDWIGSSRVARLPVVLIHLFLQVLVSLGFHEGVH